MRWCTDRFFLRRRRQLGSARHFIGVPDESPGWFALRDDRRDRHGIYVVIRDSAFGCAPQTAYISSTQIQATIPAAQLQTGAVLPLAVANGANVVAADSGNDVEVDNPEPTVATLAPSSVLVNSAAGTITVTGTNFVSGITPTVNGSPRKTTYVQCDSAHGEPYGRRLPECCACLPLLPWHMCPMSLLLLKNQLGPPPTTRKVFEPFITPMGCSQTLESSSCDHSAVGTEGRIPHLRLAEKCGIPHH